MFKQQGHFEPLTWIVTERTSIPRWYWGPVTACVRQKQKSRDWERMGIPGYRRWRLAAPRQNRAPGTASWCWIALSYIQSEVGGDLWKHDSPSCMRRVFSTWTWVPFPPGTFLSGDMYSHHPSTTHPTYIRPFIYSLVSLQTSDAVHKIQTAIRWKSEAHGDSPIKYQEFVY